MCVKVVFGFEGVIYFFLDGFFVDFFLKKNKHNRRTIENSHILVLCVKCFHFHCKDHYIIFDVYISEKIIIVIHSFLFVII